MTYRIATPVGTEPITLPEANFALRLTTDPTDVTARPTDTQVQGLITAAREFAEHATGRALAPRTVEQALECFPSTLEPISLDLPPVTVVTSIKYTDTSGVEQTLSPSKYALKTRSETPREVALTYGSVWPATQTVAEAVRVVFDCGEAELPEVLKQAMLLHIQAEFGGLTPPERADAERARDALLATKKIYGY